MQKVSPWITHGAPSSSQCCSGCFSTACWGLLGSPDHLKMEISEAFEIMWCLGASRLRICQTEFPSSEGKDKDRAKHSRLQSKEASRKPEWRLSLCLLPYLLLGFLSLLLNYYSFSNVSRSKSARTFVLGAVAEIAMSWMALEGSL